MTAQVAKTCARNSTGLGARQQAGHEVSSELLPLTARPAIAVPPVKGLDEVRACVWLRKAALTLFPPLEFGLSKLEYPPVTKFDHGHVQGLVLSA